jgi:hypothetical protein
MAKTLTSLLGDHALTIRETFKEERQAIFQKLIEKELKEHFQCYADLFDKNRQVIEALVREGMEIPYEIRVAAEVTLSDRLLQEIKGLKEDFSRTMKRGEIERIVEEAREHNFQLRKEESIRILNEMLKEEMEALQRTVIKNRATPTDNIEVQEERVKEVIQVLDLTKRWGFELSREEPQYLMGEILAECIGNLEECWWGDGAQRNMLSSQFVALAEELGFNVEKLSKMLGSSLSADQST